MWHEVRIRFNDLTYNQLKSKSIKIGVPITKVVKNIVLTSLCDDTKGSKK